jgi:hypothetical protein
MKILTLSLGRIYTKLEEEDPICCDMGLKGGVVCFVSNALLGPPGWLLVGHCLRQRAIQKYHVQEEGNLCVNCVCFPCSYFQVFVSLSEWIDDNKKGVVASTGTQPQLNPIRR